MNAAIVLIVIFRIVWLATILVGTSYIVFWLGYSGWWWALAVVLMAAGSDATVESEEKPS